jgi:hypothetical protein
VLYVLPVLWESYFFGRRGTLASTGFIANVPRFILLHDEESRGDRSDDGRAGEPQPFLLGDR